MNELFEVSLLLDFYGQLITKRQYEILDLHYNSDYSLGEIAEYLDISRQGVHDNIKRGKAALIKLEQRLGLIGRFNEHKAKAIEVLNLLGSIDGTRLEETDRGKLKQVEQGVREIIEGLE